MEIVLTVEEMREADRIAIEELGVPGLILMENAGLKSAQCIADVFGPVDGQHIGIFCGKGNNGGDGFVIGRHLSQMGAEVHFWLTGKKETLRGDAATNLHIAEKMGLPIEELDDWDPETDLDSFDLLIDALLGTGLKGEVHGIYARIIESLNRFPGPVVAVDTPSGLDGDTGQPLGTCVRADLTVTMGNVKTGMLFYPARNFIGELYIADLSVPEHVFDAIQPRKFLLSLEDYRELLPPRPADGYKNTFGKVLIFAGSTGLTGAATMASLSALRSGAGMVILGCPRSLNAILEEKLTEVMTEPLPETEAGSLAARAYDAAERVLTWADVLALGPGLSTHPETREFVHRVLTLQSRPMVIDADGLNNLQGQTDLLAQYGGPLVLTPHPGEFARLSGLKKQEIEADRIGAARRFAREWNVTLLLKGAPTLIATPEGDVFFNPTGNAGMATAGSGDVLTGLIAGFLAQGLSALHAALLGAFVHGLAGDLAAFELGQRGMIAGDLIDYLPDVLQDLESAETNPIEEYGTPYAIRLY